jgi:hypothetical protein
MENEKIAIEVLKNIAMDGSRILAERQRAIDALTLFRDAALASFKEIEKKVDVNVLKESSKALYPEDNRGGRAQHERVKEETHETRNNGIPF